VTGEFVMIVASF